MKLTGLKIFWALEGEVNTSLMVTAPKLGAMPVLVKMMGMS